MGCFHSKLVRLEDLQGLEVTNKFTVFPFQTGSIRRQGETYHVHRLGKFPFQTGSIRSTDMEVDLLDSFSFHSKLVRLEVKTRWTLVTLRRRFHSKLVRLEEFTLRQHNDFVDAEFPFQNGSIRSQSKL